MPPPYANEFSQIPQTLATNDTLRNNMLALVDSDPMPGKVLEGGNRLNEFRTLLTRLVNGEITVSEAYAKTELIVPQSSSDHSGNNRVFPSGWAERLVRTQFSRFYNQTVLRILLDEGINRCFVPHSSAEVGDSKCTSQLAGKEHDTQKLLDRLTNAYADGNWTDEVKIPDHPHCTHTITPPKR